VVRVRAGLAERLPGYMVPAAIVVIEALPLTVNGKLDVRALPAPEYGGVEGYRAPGNAVEEVLAGIYAQVLGLERVSVDDSFFDLGGDSISSMQVVAAARAAGLVCRPRDVFVEQSVSGLARVVVAVGQQGGPVDEGVGPVVATPIMRWLQSVDGCVDQFNQTMVIQAPPGVSEADVRVVVQALLDRHAVLRLGVEAGGGGGWSLAVAAVGAVDAGDCVQCVEVLSDAVVAAARAGLDPAAGVMVRAVWVTGSGELVLVVHHLAVDAVSWRILVEDLNIAWGQHCRGEVIALPAGATSFKRWAALLAEYAGSAGVVQLAGRWQQVLAAVPVLAGPRPGVDTYASAGHVSAQLDVAVTRLVVGEVAAAFHCGVQDVLLIALGLAWAEYVGDHGAVVGIDVESHGRAEGLVGDVDLSRTVGWFTAKYPVALGVGGLSWAQVVAGGDGLGAVVKGAKEQLRGLPDPLTYGLLRYLNPDIDLSGPEPTIGFNYLGRFGAATAELPDEVWRISQDSVPYAAAAAAVPLTLAHAVEVNAVTVDTEAGPSLQATWTWAPSVFDAGQVDRLSRLWFEALAGLGAHVERGGGGLTPSDITPARLDQREIEELEQRFAVADVLPLTPLQQGLLFHTTRQNSDSDLYAMQLEVTVAGPLDPLRLADAVRMVIARHPNLAARFCDQFDQPVQIIPADPEIPWQYLELDTDEQIPHICAAERAAVSHPTTEPAFRVAVIRTADQCHRVVLTNHHIVLDGWSLPILMQEIFAAYYREPLPAVASYRRFVDWLAERDVDAARAAWRQVLAGFDTPTLVGPSNRCTLGPRAVVSSRVCEQTTRAINELARLCHTTVNTVLQGAWAQTLMSMTGQPDVVFGAAVSGRPTELPGAESMVGLLINTVPVRATITPDTT
ncbi:condensation domain-containing protein, partial [Mycobacterium sp. 3519A]|uniref:condensation domain-containing protein n=1 Tax=Mycobacterium sp. 3519A TaxID=2057184 RepID=UPI001F3D591C